MTETSESHTGQCLCGDVNYRAAGSLTSVLHCHCEIADLIIDDPDGQVRWLDSVLSCDRDTGIDQRHDWHAGRRL